MTIDAINAHTASETERALRQLEHWLNQGWSVVDCLQKVENSYGALIRDEIEANYNITI